MHIEEGRVKGEPGINRQCREVQSMSVPGMFIVL